MSEYENEKSEQQNDNQDTQQQNDLANPTPSDQPTDTSSEK